MTHFKRKHKNMREVDLIPMINVILMMLFFFIIAGTVEQVEPISVDIPNANINSEVKGNPVNLILSRGGKIFFDGIQTKQDKLPQLLKYALEHDDNTLITIRADQRLPARSLTRLIEIVQKAGGTNLALEIESS